MRFCFYACITLIPRPQRTKLADAQILYSITELHNNTTRRTEQFCCFYTISRTCPLLQCRILKHRQCHALLLLCLHHAHSQRQQHRHCDWPCGDCATVPGNTQQRLEVAVAPAAAAAAVRPPAVSAVGPGACRGSDGGSSSSSSSCF